jgi:hypothetical protein
MIEETEPASFTTLDDVWRPPLERQLPRKIAKRSKSSGRSTILAPDNREIRCESLLEKKVALRLLTDQQVEHVIEQPDPVAYYDTEGKRCLHFFDFLATMKDGRKIAFAVRPEKRAAKVRAFLPLIARDAPKFADGIVLLTEKHVPHAAVANAGLILSARRSPRPAADVAVRTYVAGLHGEVTIGDVVAATGLHGDGFRAVIRAIDRGELRATTGGHLDYATRIERIATEGNAQ